MRRLVLVVAILAPSAAVAAEPGGAEAPAQKPRSALSRTVCGLPEPPALQTEGAIEAAGALADRSRRRLYQTACAANLWMDGLFGGSPNRQAARDITGRVELSAIDQAVGGTKLRAKVKAEFELPTLEGRLKAFVGRDDQDDFVSDRSEGFALRSSLFGLESEDKWLAGLGYGLPGRFFSDSDVRVGVKIREDPEVFAQGRYRKNLFVGERTAWRFRETLFWKNTRDGFGSTTSLDWDRMLAPSLLLRWGNVGTITEATDGMSWRSVLVLYQNLSRTFDSMLDSRPRAIAYEAFMRGDTEGVVNEEYGLRLIYRQTILRSYLFAEIVAGYSWPRGEDDEREGAETIGFGLEMAFGR
jgi:hypothetical protein